MERQCVLLACSSALTVARAKRHGRGRAAQLAVTHSRDSLRRKCETPRMASLARGSCFSERCGFILHSFSPCLQQSLPPRPDLNRARCAYISDSHTPLRLLTRTPLPRRDRAALFFPAGALVSTPVNVCSEPVSMDLLHTHDAVKVRPWPARFLRPAPRLWSRSAEAQARRPSLLPSGCRATGRWRASSDTFLLRSCRPSSGGPSARSDPDIRICRSRSPGSI